MALRELRESSSSKDRKDDRTERYDISSLTLQIRQITQAIDFGPLLKSEQNTNSDTVAHFDKAGRVSLVTTALASEHSASYRTAASDASADTTSPGAYFTAPNSNISPILLSKRTAAVGSGNNRRRGVNVLAPVGEAFLDGGQYLGEESEFRQLLASKNLIVPGDQELNWSGRGQHVEFTEGEEEEVPLINLGNLGSSMTASVDRVKCRRITLARKMMRCTRKWALKEAIEEVGHLHRLRHAHIVQLVGTYLLGRDFAILIYPAADCHLGRFMEDTQSSQMRYAATLQGSLARSGHTYGSFATRYISLAASLSCLAHAIRYIHSQTTKHMDIKPANILVKFVPLSIRSPNDPEYRVYIADFGLSRSFATQGHSQTEGPTSRTPKYCAPEVYDFDRRGRSADIFSLGCVYLEIVTVLLNLNLDDLADHICGDGYDESYHSHFSEVVDWVEKMKAKEWPWLDIMSSGDASKTSILSFIQRMLNTTPDKRPTAEELTNYFDGSNSHDLQAIFALKPCCSRAPEPYVPE